MSSLAAPLPLQPALVAQLRALGIKTAGHIAAVFGEVEDVDSLRLRLGEVLGPGFDDEGVMDEWVLELRELLQDAEARDARDARRVAVIPAEDRAPLSIKRRRADVVHSPVPPAVSAPAAVALLAAAMPPTKRWRTGRAMRRAEAPDEGSRARAEAAEHSRWVTDAVHLLMKMDYPVLVGSDGVQRDEKIPGSEDYDQDAAPTRTSSTRNSIVTCSP